WLQSYVEMPLPAEEAKAADAKWKIDTKELGKETVDGHPCIKNKVTMTEDGGQKYEMTTWNAEDLKKFPIKSEMQQNGMNIVTTYKNIKIGAPDAKLFEAPAGFKKYATQQELMMAAQQKMM